MTRTNHHSPSRTSSTVSHTTSNNDGKEIISQNELTIQKLLLELQDDLKKTKDCYNSSRDAWLAVQQVKSTHENSNSKGNLQQALTNVQNEIEMYKTALSKISQVRQLQIEITNVTKNQLDHNRCHTTRRGLADLLSHMAYVLKIWYGNDQNGTTASKVRCVFFTMKNFSMFVFFFLNIFRTTFHQHFVVRSQLHQVTSVTLAI